MICGISYGSVILRWQLFQLFQGKSEYTSASQFITPKARSISKLNEIIARLLDEGLAQGMRLKSVKHRILRDEKVQKPSWRSWLARQSHNLKVVSSSLTEGILFFRKPKTMIKLEKMNFKSRCIFSVYNIDSYTRRHTRTYTNYYQIHSGSFRNSSG